MRLSGFGLLPYLWFAFAVISTESRYINNTEAEEDVDLEDVLSDYYDNLMELWNGGEKEEEKAREESEEEKMKPKREESSASYSSTVPNASGNKSSYYDLAVPVQIGNVTYRFLNESYANILDMQRANRERETNEDDTTRIKDIRLSSIRDSVLSLRGGNFSENGFFHGFKQTKTLKDLLEKRVRGSITWPSSNKYAEKSQSFFPTCKVPKSTDESAWDDPLSMNLFFDVSFPVPQQDSTFMIVNAALKLFTIPQTGSEFTSGNSSTTEFGLQVNQGTVNIPNYGLVNDDDKRIRVSVYWHTRSLRRHRMKKKLLDSQMLPMNGESSLIFDVRPAVRSWKESGRNFGLLVIVEDENGTLHKPTDYVHPTDCSKMSATVKPLPLFGLDPMAQHLLEVAISQNANRSVNGTNSGNEDSQFPYRQVKYPILGLQMREVSLSEVRNLVKLRSVQMELVSRYSNGSQRRDQSADSDRSKDSTSRVTDFENVPLGMPLSRNLGPEDEEVKEESPSEQKREEGENRRKR